MAEKVMLTPDELATRWDVHINTIRRMIDRKEIAVVRAGRAIRISRSHIEYLEQHGTKKAG